LDCQSLLDLCYKHQSSSVHPSVSYIAWPRIPTSHWAINAVLWPSETILIDIPESEVGLDIILRGLFPALKAFCLTQPNKLEDNCFNFFENKEWNPSSLKDFVSKDLSSPKYTVCHPFYYKKRTCVRWNKGFPNQKVERLILQSCDGDWYCRECIIERLWVQ
jgi:hypothetical protein